MYQGYSLGAVAYILTPIVPEVLRATCECLCGFVAEYGAISNSRGTVAGSGRSLTPAPIGEARNTLETETKRKTAFSTACSGHAGHRRFRRTPAASESGHGKECSGIRGRTKGATPDKLGSERHGDDCRAVQILNRDWGG